MKERKDKELTISFLCECSNGILKLEEVEGLESLQKVPFGARMELGETFFGSHGTARSYHYSHWSTQHFLSWEPRFHLEPYLRPPSFLRKLDWKVLITFQIYYAQIFWNIQITKLLATPSWYCKIRVVYILSVYSGGCRWAVFIIIFAPSEWISCFNSHNLQVQ